MSMNELSRLEPVRPEPQEDSTHTFILRTLQPNSRHVQDVVISFPSTQHRLHSEGHSLLSFNQDNKPYTPAFIDSAQLDEKHDLDQNYRLQFQHRIKESQGLQGGQGAMIRTQNTQQIPKQHYCFVCKQQFTDYFKHIDHTVHHRKIEESVGNNYIRHLLCEFERRKKKEAALKSRSKARRKRRERQYVARSERVCSYSVSDMQDYGYSAANFQFNQQSLMRPKPDQ